MKKENGNTVDISLVEKAKSIRVGARKPKGYWKEDPEHLDLALAYANDEITLRQLAMALGIAYTGSALYGAVAIIRWGIRNGLVEIKRK